MLRAVDFFENAEPANQLSELPEGIRASGPGHSKHSLREAQGKHPTAVGIRIHAQPDGHGKRCLEEFEDALLASRRASGCGFGEGVCHGAVPCNDHCPPRQQGRWLREHDNFLAVILGLSNLGVNNLGRERHVE